MCGIVGYLGSKQAAPILLTGLKRLEYRGYDSAGAAILDGDGLHVRRVAGRVADLETRLVSEPLEGSIGIAHTRWATHGRPTERNAHPHVDAQGKVALVHNGIIENHSTLRSYLEGEGVKFSSDTDTEALAQLIGFLYARDGGNFGEAVRQALASIKGTYGVAILCSECPGYLWAARKGSPLLVGVGDDEYVVASDGSAIIEHTSQVIYLNDGEMVELGPEGLAASTIDAKPLEKKIDRLELSLEQIELGGYEHYMLKEIHEQPKSLRECMAGRLDVANGMIKLGGLTPVERELARARRVLMLGCGSAWHAGIIGEHLLEELALVNTEVHYASELRYRNPIIEEGTIAIAVSQSGETADTLAALREVTMKGATPLGVVNAVGSTIARDTEAGVYLHAGPEIGVASTKAFTAQIAVLAMMALHIGRRRYLSPERTFELVRELDAIPDKVERALVCEPQMRGIAERLQHRNNWLFLGRGVNYPVALEGALKLKETSYIHAEGMPAAEMKHGPIALIEEGMPVVFVAPHDHVYEKVISNIEEVRGRQGYVIAIASEGDDYIHEVADEVIFVPATAPLLSPLVTSIPLQLLAYHAAVIRGKNVDKPRNLAKSVTVE